MGLTDVDGVDYCDTCNFATCVYKCNDGRCHNPHPENVLARKPSPPVADSPKGEDGIDAIRRGSFAAAVDYFSESSDPPSKESLGKFLARYGVAAYRLGRDEGLIDGRAEGVIQGRADERRALRGSNGR